MKKQKNIEKEEEEAEEEMKTYKYSFNKIFR